MGMPDRCTNCGRFLPKSGGDCACVWEAYKLDYNLSRADEYGIRRIIQEELAKVLSSQRIRTAESALLPKFEDGWSILLSDIHIPLHHIAATRSVLQFLAENENNRVILAGDVFDGTNLSRYDKNSRYETHNLDFGEEVRSGAEFFHALADSTPEIIYLAGNHEARMEKLLAKVKGIPAEALDMDNLFKLYEYPELTVHKDRVYELGVGESGRVRIIHGEKYNKHRAAGLLEENLYQSTVQGHTHRPQTYWCKGRFGHVNGYLHDPRRQNYMPDPSWTLGFTILEHWDNGTQVNPYFIRIADDGSFSFGGKVYRG